MKVVTHIMSSYNNTLIKVENLSEYLKIIILLSFRRF